jgi:hypothetical protein
MKVVTATCRALRYIFSRAVADGRDWRAEAQVLAERLADDDWQPSIVLVGFLRKAQLHVSRFLTGRFARASSAAIAASALP